MGDAATELAVVTGEALTAEGMELVKGSIFVCTLLGLVRRGGFDN